MGEWRTVDSVPKVKRRDVLLYGDGHGFSDCMFFGVFNDNGDGWTESFSGRIAFPTHWQPSPTPPKGEE